MSSAEEIWSSRLQRELVFLVSSQDDEDEQSQKHHNLGTLPPFIKIKEHNLDINEKTCTVSFAIDIDNTTSNNKKQNEQQQQQEEEAAQQDNVVDEQKEIIITLDASLQRTGSNNGTDTATSYPFFKPKVYLTSGSQYLPPSSDITDGSMVQIDCDWTPSLHLNDAALNIALKVRESVKRNENCLRLEPQQHEFSNNQSTVGSFFSSLKTKASALVEEVDNKLDVAMRDKPRSNVARNNHHYEQLEVKIITEDNVDIGDVIDLSQRPWNTNAVGMYPCRAIRRPVFVEDAIQAANERINNERKVREDFEDENEIPHWSRNYLQLQSGSVFQVAGSGLRGAGSMFRSFSRSAKSLVEESFLVLTKELILEIKCTKFSVSTATVSFCIPISQLAKLKFRREESISLFFKNASDDPMIYMCQSSADAVKQIQAVLKQHGVRGKHTNTTMMKTVQAAIDILNDVKEKEKALEVNPRPDKVTEIMDLYRQAAEKFEMAGDKRHEDAMALMREFLAKPLVSGILDGSVQPKSIVLEESTTMDPYPDENEFLSSKDEVVEKKEDENLERAMKAAEDMLNTAHNELTDLGVSNDFENDDGFTSSNATNQFSSSTEEKKDVVSEFEDMLADADKELEELMGSS